jgi:hypothetical protein
MVMLDTAEVFAARCGIPREAQVAAARTARW